MNAFNQPFKTKMFLSHPTQSISISIIIPTNAKGLLYFWFSELICELVFVKTTGIT